MISSDREHGDDRHQPHVARADRGRLAEEEFVDAAFVPGRQPLDHRDEADSDGEKRREHEAERRVFLQARRLLDQADDRRADQPGDGRADEDRDRIFRLAPEKPERHARQHRVRKRVADQRHLAHDDEAAEQAAGDAEQDRADERVAQRRILEGEEAQRLLARCSCSRCR